MEDIYVKLQLTDLNQLIGCVTSGDFKVNHPPHRSVKEEFEKFVRAESNTRRDRSSIKNLRGLHNEIKRTFIEKVANLVRSENKGDVNLLDIAVGRGGDISKWKSAYIKNVFGFDKSRDSIESINPFNQGARERLRNYKGLKTNVEFQVGDATNPSPELLNHLSQFVKKNGLFSIMSCQFALHYFFESEERLRNVFEVFSRFIKPGGYFIGTTVDGNKIIELLKQNAEIHEPLLSIKKGYKAAVPRKPYNNKYTFKINDSQDQAGYFNTMGESVEYLVNFGELSKVAAEYSFEPYLYNIFLPTTKPNEYASCRSFVSFEEINRRNYLGMSELKPEEVSINNLYTTFIFKKRR